MDFTWALERLTAGDRVRRTGWSRWGLYIVARTIPGYRYRKDRKAVFIVSDDGETKQWRARPYDEERADDWVLVTEDMLVELLTLDPKYEPTGIYWMQSGSTINMGKDNTGEHGTVGDIMANRIAALVRNRTDN